MATSCYGSINVCFLRWADLTSGGAPNPGASNGYVTDAVIQLGVEVELEEGADVTRKNGCGAICQSYRGDDKVKRTNLDTTLCDLDNELIQLMVGGAVIQDSGDTIGYELPTDDDASPNGGCLEVWSKAWDGTAQATSGGSALYWHFVFPWCKFSPGSFTLQDEEFLAFPLTGRSTKNSAITVNGPWNDWPTAVANFGGITSSGGWFYETAVPTAACGYQTVPSGS